MSFQMSRNEKKRRGEMEEKKMEDGRRGRCGVQAFPPFPPFPPFSPLPTHPLPHFPVESSNHDDDPVYLLYLEHLTYTYLLPTSYRTIVYRYHRASRISHVRISSPLRVRQSGNWIKGLGPVGGDGKVR